MPGHKNRDVKANRGPGGGAPWYRISPEYQVCRYSLRLGAGVKPGPHGIQDASEKVPNDDIKMNLKNSLRHT
jgi:hypothetical protein